MTLGFPFKLLILLTVASVICHADFNVIKGNLNIKLLINFLSGLFQKVTRVGSYTDNCESLSIIDLPGFESVNDWLRSWMCSGNSKEITGHLTSFMHLLVVPLLQKHFTQCETTTPVCSKPVGPANLYISYQPNDRNSIVQYDLTNDDENAPIFKKREDYFSATDKVSDYLLLSSSGKQLYSVESDSIAVYNNDLCTGKLTWQNTKRFGKTFSATFDPDERYLLVPDYVSNCVNALKLGDNGTLESTDSFNVEPSNNKSNPLAIKFYPNIKNVLAVSLSNVNKIRFLEINVADGKLKLLSAVAMLATKSGPEIIEFKGNYMYVLGLNSKTVTGFKIVESGGTIASANEITTKSALKPTDIASRRDVEARMIIHRNGNFLYTLVGKHYYIGMFTINSDGTLSEPVFHELDGSGYGMVITPDGKWLIVSRYKKDVVFIYKINQLNGSLTKIGSISDLVNVMYILYHQK